MRLNFLTVVILMGFSGMAIGNADEIYRTGPETLIAQSPVIVTGRVLSFRKEILTMSGPAPNGMPVMWKVSGRIDAPEVLKGRWQGPIAFSREEKSMMLPPTNERPTWETELGDLLPEDKAVIFLSGTGPNPEMKVLPSGKGERDLAALTSHVVAIHAVQNSEARTSAWLGLLTKSPTDEGRKAALRSLLHERVSWNALSPALLPIFAESSPNPQMRAFTFGIVAFGIKQGLWGSSMAPVEFLCRVFDLESQPRTALQYILHLKLLLTFLSKADAHANEPSRLRILAAMQHMQPTVAHDAAVAEQYRQIQAMFPH